MAEQNLVGIATGLAMTGKIPFAASFASFCPGRCLDQIRMQICLNKLKVVIVGSHAGLSHPKDGVSVQATEDIAIMRSMPHMVVVVPADYNQTIAAVQAIYACKQAVYIRIAREPTAVFSKKSIFKIGQAQLLKTGGNLTLISAGPLLAEVLQAAQKAESFGISCEVINLSTIKPIDSKTIIRSAKKTKAILTIEDHQQQGGLGSAVAEVIVKNYSVKMQIMGLNNEFGRTSKDYQSLIKYYHLDSDSILSEIKKIKAVKKYS